MRSPAAALHRYDDLFATASTRFPQVFSICPVISRAPRPQQLYLAGTSSRPARSFGYPPPLAELAHWQFQQPRTPSVKAGVIPCTTSVTDGQQFQCVETYRDDPHFD